nr:hypothetical protein [Janthinobacterium sp. Marseille]
MNKYAVVIAADSAVTFTDENGKERYSKGGNKIFQLSSFEPVGVMIFGSAKLDGVPWEIIIKSYRDDLGKVAFATLEEYSTSFCDYVKQAEHFFPQSDLLENFQKIVTTAAIRLLKRCRDKYPQIDDSTKPVGERTVIWDTYVAEQLTELAAIPFHAQVTQEDVATALAEIETVTQKDPSIANYLQGENLDGVLNISEWFSLATQFVIKCHDSILSGTGIVFSGYGKDQYFPEVIEYSISGFVRYDLLFRREAQNSAKVTHAEPSGIFQFAMTSSIHAFIQGVDLSSFGAARDRYKIHAKNLVQNVLSSANVPIPTDLDDMVNKSEDEWSDGWVGEISEKNYHPIKRVISSLPVDEMVHLAETLVVLQSLKERVTSSSQSVGGPIDVAVITKSEGLVWINRKHFFDSEKNLRYVMRQKALYS